MSSSLPLCVAELAAVDLTSLLVTLALGGVCGWVASILMKTDGQMGIVANVVVGVVGAWLAGWLAPMVGLSFGGLVGSLIVATAGAVLLIIALRFLGIFK